MTVIVKRNSRWGGVDYTANQSVTNSAVEQAMVDAGFAMWAIGSGPSIPAGSLGKEIKNTGQYGLDDASRAAVALSSNARSANLIGAAWGDSLIANGYTTNAATTGMHWLKIADQQLGGVFKHIYNGGVSGERTDAMVARLDALLSNNPDIFIIGPNSVNDIDPAKGTILTAAQTQANYEVAFAKAFATASVRQVWVATIHRPSSGYIAAVSATGEAVRQWYDSMDAYIRAKATSDPRIQVIEFARAVGDSLGVALRNNYNATGSDTTHVGYLGASAAAQAVKTVMNKLSFTPWNMPQFGQDCRNLLGPCASSLQGSFASGSGNVQAGTGITLTTAPGGLNARRMTGDAASTATNVNALASPVGLPGQSVTLDYTIGQIAGGVGVQFGAAATGNFDNARTNSTAYTWGSRIYLSATLCGQCLVPGTSAASLPDFSSAVAGSRIVDGTVTWLVTEIPQLSDTLLIEADLSITANAGGAAPVVWINFIDNLGNQYATWINVANNASQLAWPTDTGRILLRNYLPVPVMTGTAVRNILVLVGVQGQNASTGTLQVHRASVKRGV